MSGQETIFAVATGQGVAGVAIIRLSGDRSWDIVEQVTRQSLPEPRRLSRRWIYDKDAEHIDDCMIVVFQAGASFTGEMTAELQCHGSRAVLNAVLQRLGTFAGCREAEPGEFTRRAFDAGLMDLNEVEGLADLVHAETEFQRRQALRVMSGAASDQIATWRASLVRARALVEVTIDWADEEVPEDVSPEVADLLEKALKEIKAELARFNQTERLREGFEVAIIGSPNVGKSTLINAIAGREVAITSDLAGTTRDVIEIRCDLQGLPVTFLDTAGLRESDDQIEIAGVQIARRRAMGADLRIFLSTTNEPAPDAIPREKQDLNVWSKSDLGRGIGDILVSGMTGDGVQDLLDAVEKRLRKRADQVSVFGHRRQNAGLQRCADAIQQAAQDDSAVDGEVLAEHLRIALAQLDSLTGRNAVEDVLGAVFSSFCLGK